jgi:hypothetical protein
MATARARYSLTRPKETTMNAQQIMDRYPWVSEEDAKRIAELAAIRQQQTIYEEAERLKPR